MFNYNDLPKTTREKAQPTVCDVCWTCSFEPIDYEPGYRCLCCWQREQLEFWIKDREEWRQQYAEEFNTRLRLSEALGTLVMVYHVCDITDKVWEDFKSTGDVIADPSSGKRKFMVVAQGPEARKKLYGTVPESIGQTKGI